MQIVILKDSIESEYTERFTKSDVEVLEMSLRVFEQRDSPLIERVSAAKGRFSKTGFNLDLLVTFPFSLSLSHTHTHTNTHISTHTGPSLVG